jgi:hypothetical protein
MIDIQEILLRVRTDVERPTGPLALRFYIQPAVADSDQ